MANSRDNILARIRSAKLENVPLPELRLWGDAQNWDSSSLDKIVETVGGSLQRAENLEMAEALVRSTFSSAKKSFCAVEGLSLGNLSLDDLADSSVLDRLDLAILAGEFLVAENGAIWITQEQMKNRSILASCHHMAVLVPAGEVVATMHQAYQRIDIGASDYGVFLSGPSKTADIEQTLVFGAHGAKSLLVILVGQ